MTDYCTVTEVRSQINKSGTEDDVTIGAIISAVSLNVDNFCNRPDGFEADSSASVRIYSGSGDTVQWIDECVAVSLVEVKDSPTDTDYEAWAADTWLAATGDPLMPDFNRTPYAFILVSATGDYDLFTSGQFTTRRGFRPRGERRRGVPTVRVTARWGYAASTPDVVKQACIVESARIYKRGQSAFADALATTDVGKLVYAKQLDPIVKQMLINGRLVKPAIGRRF